jgi:hypothetical protein
MIWMQNKAFKSGMVRDPTCYAVRNLKTWNTSYTHVQTIHPRSGCLLETLTLAFSCHIGEFIPSIPLISLEIVYNKPRPFFLLHLQGKNKQKVVILFLQKVKLDVIFRHAELEALQEDKKNYNCMCKLSLSLTKFVCPTRE